MVDADMETYLAHFPGWRAALGDVGKICLLSPDKKQVQLVQLLFPAAAITTIGQDEWNLDSPVCRGDVNYDLIFAANVFMYSRNPRLWFENVLARCRYFWIQDLVRGQRMTDRELGSDGDSCRYSRKSHGITVHEGVPSFDLSCFDDRILEYETYVCGSTGKSLHFVASIRGDGPVDVSPPVLLPSRNASKVTRSIRKTQRSEG